MFVSSFNLLPVILIYNKDIFDPVTPFGVKCRHSISYDRDKIKLNPAAVLFMLV